MVLTTILFVFLLAMVDLQRDIPLFDKFMPIQLHDSSNETRTTTLVFRIIAGSQPASVVGQTERLYHFEVIFNTVTSRAVVLIIIYCR